ncbi:MAG: sigma-70 family RNA polymerase sigma factor [Acidobacteria bacterium]|nr:sigma-70 family RNA polymerase sigma factor [Acidobacteriota bacterium]
MTSAQTDSALIERLQAGDDTAVAELARDYGAKMYQLALRYTRNKEDAEEVVQDVLLKVRDKIDAFRGDAALSSWIYRITFNTAMSRLRATRSTRMHEVPDEPIGTHDDIAPRTLEPADWSNLGDELVHRRQMRDALRVAVAELPAIYREPVILRDLRGLSTEEASRQLKVKDQTLKSRLHRGRLILRDRLANFASGLALHHAAPVH